MKERVQGIVAGLLIGAVFTGGAALAKSKTETIDVVYDNIKVYKDNVLCELKDSNGSVIEPFIYNGTTYMPVRGTASLADMQVTWDGANKSVYLWDEMVPDRTYLMEVCRPYEKKNCDEYLQQEGKSFQMAGKKYSNGFVLTYVGGYAMFNLDSKYSEIEFTIGHVDDTYIPDEDYSIYFYVDGRLAKTVEVGGEALPKTVKVPVNYGLQLKVLRDEEVYSGEVGLADITVR